MTPSRPRPAIAVARTEDRARRLALQALLTGAAIIALTAAAMAQEADSVATSHGYSNYGELKYGPTRCSTM